MWARTASQAKIVTQAGVTIFLPADVPARLEVISFSTISTQRFSPSRKQIARAQIRNQASGRIP